MCFLTHGGLDCANYTFVYFATFAKVLSLHHFFFLQAVVTHGFESVSISARIISKTFVYKGKG